MTAQQFRDFEKAARIPESGVVPLILTPHRSAAVPRKLAMIGTFGPRKCGIATFTTDVVEKLAAYHPEIATQVWALDDPRAPLAYDGVAGVIRQDEPGDYRDAAAAINAAGVDAVWLQHEYGIFGGPDGAMARELVDRVAAPLILTLHTVLPQPSESQRSVLEHLIQRASRIMVMSLNSRDLLHDVHGVDPALIEVIEHGAPDRPFGRGTSFKAEQGLSGRNVLMTFGLIGPGKGLERVIEALPAIVARHPDTLYRIVGATHPNLLARDGEAYRDGLIALARRLGVEQHVAWDNRFLDTDELLDQLEACDIYVTPYFNLAQSTSGTLSYAVGLGKAVVSTPYVHARELLADGVGALIEPDSSAAIANAVNALLDAPDDLVAMQRRAWARGRRTIWPAFAAATARLVESAAAPRRRPTRLAAPSLAGVFAMSDSTGMLQHAIGVVPDRRHGYCLDDNARALMLMNVADGIDAQERMRWSTVYASFIQHAWNPDVQAFRNFMRFDREWCEDQGSEDSNGRALWALGHTAARSPEPDLRAWAADLFDTVHPIFVRLDSPRTQAFAMLGAAEILRVSPDHPAARDLLIRGGTLLAALLDRARRPDWAWFEAVLGYDNPRLPQALIEAGMALGRSDWTAAGVETLSWIADRQTATGGHFRAVGSQSFHHLHAAPMPFDQQPLEAQAAAEAAASAFAATGDPRWTAHALAAWRWYLGANDRGVVLGDLASGRCRDGVTPRGVNANCGAESILAFQLAYSCVIGMVADNDSTAPGDILEPRPRSFGESAAHSRHEAAR